MKVQRRCVAVVNDFHGVLGMFREEYQITDLEEMMVPVLHAFGGRTLEGEKVESAWGLQIRGEVVACSLPYGSLEVVGVCQGGVGLLEVVGGIDRGFHLERTEAYQVMAVAKTVGEHP